MNGATRAPDGQSGPMRQGQKDRDGRCSLPAPTDRFAHHRPRVRGARRFRHQDSSKRSTEEGRHANTHVVAGSLGLGNKSVSTAESGIESASSTNTTSDRASIVGSAKSPRSNRQTDSPISEQARRIIFSRDVFPVPAMPAMTITLRLSRICPIASSSAVCAELTGDGAFDVALKGFVCKSSGGDD